jgi:hypothetical protein
MSKRNKIGYSKGGMKVFPFLFILILSGCKEHRRMDWDNYQQEKTLQRCSTGLNMGGNLITICN